MASFLTWLKWSMLFIVTICDVRVYCVMALMKTYVVVWRKSVLCDGISEVIRSCVTLRCILLCQMMLYLVVWRPTTLSDGKWRRIKLAIRNCATTSDLCFRWRWILLCDVQRALCDVELATENKKAFILNKILRNWIRRVFVPRMAGALVSNTKAFLSLFLFLSLDLSLSHLLPGLRWRNRNQWQKTWQKIFG